MVSLTYCIRHQLTGCICVCEYSMLGYIPWQLTCCNTRFAHVNSLSLDMLISFLLFYILWFLQRELTVDWPVERLWVGPVPGAKYLIYPRVQNSCVCRLFDNHKCLFEAGSFQSLNQEMYVRGELFYLLGREHLISSFYCVRVYHICSIATMLTANILTTFCRTLTLIQCKEVLPCLLYTAYKLGGFMHTCD